MVKQGVFHKKVEDYRRHLFVLALHGTKGCVRSAARVLEISERSGWRLVEEYGLDLKDYKIPVTQVSHCK